LNPRKVVGHTLISSNKRVSARESVANIPLDRIAPKLAQKTRKKIKEQDPRRRTPPLKIQNSIF